MLITKRVDYFRQDSAQVISSRIRSRIDRWTIHAAITSATSCMPSNIAVQLYEWLLVLRRYHNPQLWCGRALGRRGLRVIRT